MGYYRYASDEKGNVVRGDYNSDGDWIGRGPDPRTTQMTYWRRIVRTAVTDEIVALASKRSGIQVEVRSSGPMYQGLDLGSNYQAQLWAIFPRGGFMGPFDDELRRLERLVRTPLDEPVLADDNKMYGGFWYLMDGDPAECAFYVDDENSGVTVASFKERFYWKTIQRCDVIGRRLRQEKNPEFGAFAKNAPSDQTVVEAPASNRPWYNTQRRRPRCSNKIKKVR